MQWCAVLALLGAVALCPTAQGRSAVIGLSGDDTRHGIAVLYGNFGGKQSNAADPTSKFQLLWLGHTFEVPKKLELTRYHVDTLIQTRFARTTIEAEIWNNGPAQKTTVPFAIPENAMLVTFEIDDSNGKVHQARPMLRDAIVVDSTSNSSTIKARNAEAFDVDIEFEGSGSVVLRVVYEELLTRQREKYTNVQQVWPGQVVSDLKLSVRIKESSPIDSVNFIFSTESANSVVTAPLDQLVSVVNVSDSEVLLTMQPTARQQQQLAKNLGLSSEVGVAGQFNVEYDVARYPTAGDIVVRDGYFAYFFAPSELKAIPKYALFLLDVSSSMSGRKIQQLSDAMVTILGQLGADDVFTVIEFSLANSMWDLGSLPSQSSTPAPTPANACNTYSSQYIALAQERAKSMIAGGDTAMLGGLQQAIACAASSAAGREPILVMLTDGIPNEPTPEIQSDTARANAVNGKAGNLVTSIFTLALGDDADAAFLRELALRNGGKFQQIYEAADASVELQKFYESISSPLLTDVTVTFDYQQAEQSSVTQKDFRTYFWGSELVVAGRLLPGQGDALSGVVTATGYGGQAVTYPIKVTAQPSWQPQTLGGQANSERLWAFLYTKQHLDQEVLDGPTSAAANASIDMALEYSFVTPHTCLAVDIVNPYQAPTLPPKPTTVNPPYSPSTPAGPPSPPAPTGPPSPPAPTNPPTPAPTNSPAPTAPPAPTGAPAPTGRPGPPAPGPATPPSADTSGAKNVISIGSISVGSMTVNGPLIQFSLR